MARRSLGRRFGRLWAAYAVSTFGTWLAFDAFPLIAILVLHAGPTAVSALSAAGPAVGAVVAVPFGPWVEFRRKRPVMIATDLTRFAALMSVAAAFALDRLTYGQLLIVSVIVAAAGIASKAAAGAFLKELVPREDLLVANGRFESTTWTATALGPPLGGAAIGLFGPVTTVVADAVSYLFSAAGIRAIGGDRPPRRLRLPRTAWRPRIASPGRMARPVRLARPVRPARPVRGARAARAGASVRIARSDAPGLRGGDLLEGWRYILAHPGLRALFLNTVVINSLILATAPLLAVLMLGRLGFAPWQYGLAFGAPCVGGLIGARLARPVAARFGRHRAMLTFGALRACWSVGLAFVMPGVGGLVLVIAVQLGLVASVGVFNPIFATYRLDQTPPDRVARVLSAWSVTNNITVAGTTALWGLLAGVTSPRTAIAAAGLLILTTPLLLPRRDHALPTAEAAADADSDVKRVADLSTGGAPGPRSLDQPPYLASWSTKSAGRPGSVRPG